MAKLLDQTLLTEVAQKAGQRDRLRQNYNFHNLPDTAQRMLNAMQPGTYVRPHRHLRSPQKDGFEFFLVQQGKVGVLTFNPKGVITNRYLLHANGSLRGIELEEGTFHALISLSTDTVIFELKEGPYDATCDKEFLTNFPVEGTEAAIAQVKEWEQEFTAVPAN